MKRKVLTLICAVAVGVSALAFNRYPLTQGKTATSQQPAGTTVGTKESPSPSQAPEHVVYRQFFRHLVALKKRASEIESQGRDGKALRAHYKDKIGLKDKEASLLDEIAVESEREVGKIDKKAQKIINAARNRFPNGLVPASQQLPPPPAELKSLQRKRDMIVLRGRHRLVTELGAYGFQQIDDFLKLKFTPDLKPAALRPRQPASAQQAPPVDGGK
jgi:hypothetical protein